MELSTRIQSDDGMIFFRDIKVDWIGMAQSVLRYNIVIVGKFFGKGSWASEAWKKSAPRRIW